MANFSLGAVFKIGRENLQESVLHAFLCTTKEVRMPKFIFQPGLKLSSCNRKRLLKKICLGSRAKISAQLTGLKLAMKSAPKTTKD